MSGRHEGGRQGTVPECPRVPDRPVRRRGGELRPAVLRCTEADWGNPAHPAPACSCCLHPAAGGSASVYSSPRAAPCRSPRSRAADAAASSQAALWSRPQGSLTIWLRLGGESFVSFSATGLTVSGTQNLDKRAVSSISGSPEGTGVCERVKLELHSPSSLASGQLWAVQEGGQSHYSRTLCRNAGKCVTHADPASDRQRDARAGSMRSPSLPHRGYVSGSVGVGGLLVAWLALPNPSRCLLRTIRLGYAIQFARRPPKYRGIHSTTVRAADAPILRAEIAVLLAKDAIEPVPPADMRSGFYSPYFIVPKKSGGLRPILNLGSARLEPGPSQAPVQNAHTETHLWVRPSPRLVCSDRPEGRVLPHVDPSAPQAIPAVCVRRTGISVQSPALRAVPVAPSLHESSGGSPCSPGEQGVRILNYLDD